MFNRFIIPASLIISVTKSSQPDLTNTRLHRDPRTGIQTVELEFPGLDRHIFVSVGGASESTTEYANEYTTTTARPRRSSATTELTTETTTSHHHTVDYCSLICIMYTRATYPSIGFDLCGPSGSSCVSGVCRNLYWFNEGLISSETETDLTREEMSNPLRCHSAEHLVATTPTSPSPDLTNWWANRVTTETTTETTTATTETTETTTESTTEATTEASTEYTTEATSEPTTEATTGSPSRRRSNRRGLGSR